MDRHNYAIRTYAEIYPHGANDEQRGELLKEICAEYGEKFGDYSIEMERLTTEIRAIDMMESCWCYSEMEHWYGKYYAEYAKDYVEKYYGNLQDFNRAMEIQLAYLVTRCVIRRNVYTDSEGLSYNCIVEK